MGFESENNASNRPLIVAQGWGDLFGSPVIDSRLAPAPIDSENITDRGAKGCESMPRTNNKEDSLASMALGDSIMDRLYEVAVETPQGKTRQKDFEANYGPVAAAKLIDIGVKQITHKGFESTIEFTHPLQFGDGNVTVDINSAVSFLAVPAGGAVTIDRLNGVTATSGIFTVPVNTVELQPRTNGYLTAIVSAGYMAGSEPEAKQGQPRQPEQVQNLCVLPNGKIYH